MEIRKVAVTLAGLLALLTTQVSAQVLWDPEQQLTTNPYWSYVGYNNARCVATRGPEVHVLWADNRYQISTSEILYRRSTDNGTTWEPFVRLSNDPANSDYPSMAVSGSLVHAVWQDDRDGNSEIYHARSTDGGVAWEPEVRLTSDAAVSAFCSIAASDPFVHVVWEDSRHGLTEVYSKRSTDNGLTWGPDVRLTDATGASRFPSISLDGTNLYLVWHDHRDLNSEVYFKRSTDAGSTWGDDTRLTNDPAASENPSLAVDGSNLHLAWTDRRDDPAFEVYHMGSTDSGASWSSPARLSYAAGQSYNPSIAASGNHVHVLWHDERAGNPDIYYAGSTDLGASWSQDANLSNDPDVSYSPFVALAGSRVHVIWQDGRNPGASNHDIYYRRGVTVMIFADGFEEGTTARWASTAGS